jgi:hypothetical protein
MVEQQLVEKTEIAFLNAIVDMLEKGELELEKAQQVSQQFLALLPFNDDADMDAKLKTFVEEHNEFKGVYVSFMRYEDDKKKQALVHNMRALMKEGKIEEALQLTK